MSTRVIKVVSAAVLFLGLAFLQSCAGGRRAELGPEEYVKAFDDLQAGVFTRQINEVSYRLQYRPLDYVLLKEQGPKVLEGKQWDTLAKEYSAYDYYMLELNVDKFNDELMKYNLGSAAEYEERVRYYSFEFQKDIVLLEGQDTIPCSGFHFERTYGLSPGARFLFSFPHRDPAKERTIICREKYLGKGTVKFNITPEDLSNTPTLKRL